MSENREPTVVPKRARDPGAGGVPWWLEAEADCPFCLQTHALSMAYHCFGCDRSVCPTCAVEVEIHRRALCPECRVETT